MSPGAIRPPWLKCTQRCTTLAAVPGNRHLPGCNVGILPALKDGACRASGQCYPGCPQDSGRPQSRCSPLPQPQIHMDTALEASVTLLKLQSIGLVVLFQCHYCPPHRVGLREWHWGGACGHLSHLSVCSGGGKAVGDRSAINITDRAGTRRSESGWMRLRFMPGTEKK